MEIQGASVKNRRRRAGLQNRREQSPNRREQFPIRRPGEWS